LAFWKRQEFKCILRREDGVKPLAKRALDDKIPRLQRRARDDRGGAIIIIIVMSFAKIDEIDENVKMPFDTEANNLDIKIAPTPDASHAKAFLYSRSSYCNMCHKENEN
jgi:hypothetical protein